MLLVWNGQKTLLAKSEHQVQAHVYLEPSITVYSLKGGFTWPKVYNKQDDTPNLEKHQIILHKAIEITRT